MNLYQNNETPSMLTGLEQIEVIDSPKLLLYFHNALHRRLYCYFSRKRTCCSMQCSLSGSVGSFVIQVLAVNSYALYESFFSKWGKKKKERERQDNYFS